ncbi:MAG: S46 family peptidase [Bacteroidales bacterium]|nr:S46 family peptidase [Bacteroidales bacterium]
MKKFLAFVFSLSILSAGTSRADEGMWMLPLLQALNMPEMEEMGIQLTAEQIYSINHSSLKDAIVIFGGGCTGEIVSSNGLIFTNHHCGYDEIQSHSSLEHDYLTDGFWAMSGAEELPNPGLTVKFLDRIEDVTDQIMKELSDQMLEEDREAKIEELIQAIKDDAGSDDHQVAYVAPFYEGNKYYLLVYTEYKDVRLVGAPPSSIGKFGYDTDNWQWPRHTGDFSIFRVYTAPDGSPAEYSGENIPLNPKYYLPVSIDGVKEGDFTFVMGYPGSTERYKSSFGIQETIDVENTCRIQIRSRRLSILQEDMLMDPKVRIQYASKFSRSSNYYKYSIGQNKGVASLKVLEKKREEEAAFQKWAESDTLLEARYGNVLKNLESIYRENKPKVYNAMVIVEAFFRSAEIIDLVTEFQRLHRLMNSKERDDAAIAEEIEELKTFTEEFFKNYNLSTDIKINKEMFRLYSSLVPEEQLPSVYQIINKKFKGDTDRYIEKMFAQTFFTEKDKVVKFLENPSAKALEKDLAYETGTSILWKYFEELDGIDQTGLEKQQRLYLEGRLKMDPEKLGYPDANSTLRLSYGVVDSYSPADAVHYDEITFLKGVMEKEDTANFEFVVPEKLKELYHRQDYGRYGLDDGTMPVCFITNNDITGGNSGSPVLNARGELIGLAFDGNLEAMSGDIAFEPDIQRCICVDIRYVLFIIDKYAGAGYLVDELKIVN